MFATMYGIGDKVVVLYGLFLFVFTAIILLFHFPWLWIIPIAFVVWFCYPMVRRSLRNR